MADTDPATTLTLALCQPSNNLIADLRGGVDLGGLIYFKEINHEQRTSMDNRDQRGADRVDNGVLNHCAVHLP